MITSDTKKYIVIKEKLARLIFKELGDIAGLTEKKGLSKLEQIISDTIDLEKD